MYNRNRRPSFREMTSSTANNGGDVFPVLNRFSPSINPLPTISRYEASRQLPLIPDRSSFLPYANDQEHEKRLYIEDSESSDNSNSKSRKASLNKAERRAEHNAIERARRECLNSKFSQLAEVLPNLHNHRRPSKGQIVEKALDWVKQNMSKENRYQYQIMQLQNENRRLMNQINIAQEQSANRTATSPNASSQDVSYLPNSHQPPRFSKNSFSNTSDGEKMCKESSPRNYNQIDEMDIMYPLTTFGVEWHHQPIYSNNSSNTECVFPSASTSSSSGLIPEDDDESNSSNEEIQNYHVQMTYNDMSQRSPFDINHSLSSKTNASWSKIPLHSQYPAANYSSTDSTYNPYA